MRFASLLLALLAIMSAAVSRTEAAALTVSPLHVTLPPDGQPTTVRVENESTSETLVQVSVVEWSEPGEVDAAPEAREVIAVPPIFKLGPDREQVIRLALRGPLAGPWQGRYRLLITEVPREMAVTTGVVIAARINLPVLVGRAGAVTSSR